LPTPALFVSLLAPFLALGGGVAVANGLISGKQIANHSIPENSVVAWNGTIGKLSRFDLGGFHGTGSCNVWGVIIPASN
jgi:hypothetical protein